MSNETPTETTEPLPESDTDAPIASAAAPPPEPAPEGARPPLPGLQGLEKYFGVVCSVQLKVPLWMVDCKEALIVGADANRQPVFLGVTMPALAPADEGGGAYSTDILHAVQLTASACGRRVQIHSQVRVEGPDGPGGAIVVYIVDPEQILSIAVAHPTEAQCRDALRSASSKASGRKSGHIILPE